MEYTIGLIINIGILGLYTVVLIATSMSEAKGKRQEDTNGVEKIGNQKVA